MISIEIVGRLKKPSFNLQRRLEFEIKADDDEIHSSAVTFTVKSSVITFWLEFGCSFWLQTSCRVWRTTVEWEKWDDNKMMRSILFAESEGKIVERKVGRQNEAYLMDWRWWPRWTALSTTKIRPPTRRWLVAPICRPCSIRPTTK